MFYLGTPSFSSYSMVMPQINTCKKNHVCRLVRKCRRIRQHKLTLRGNLKAIRLKANNADFNKTFIL